MGSMSYEQSGVKYDTLDAFKRACQREAIAPGSCSVARAMPPRLDLSGESPATQLSSAPDQETSKFPVIRRQS